ncbi:hypothetical protein Ddc_09324 [Ditylenchus destructor]|nr:hypothetical protein Ddc_09324 [Ditylenchus destructor]
MSSLAPEFCPRGSQIIITGSLAWRRKSKLHYRTTAIVVDTYSGDISPVAGKIIRSAAAVYLSPVPEATHVFVCKSAAVGDSQERVFSSTSAEVELWDIIGTY